MNELAVLVRSRIARASAGIDGSLSLTFEGEPARRIIVPPLERYEAWMYTHGNYILACPPGGLMDPLPDETP
jgi:hypothetical protein